MSGVCTMPVGKEGPRGGCHGRAEVCVGGGVYDGSMAPPTAATQGVTVSASAQPLPHMRMSVPSTDTMCVGAVRNSAVSMPSSRNPAIGPVP